MVNGKRQVFFIFLFLLINSIPIYSEIESDYQMNVQGVWGILDQNQIINNLDDYNKQLSEYRELQIDNSNINFYNLLEDTTIIVGEIISINDKTFIVSIQDSINSKARINYQRMNNILILWEDKENSIKDTLILESSNEIELGKNILNYIDNVLQNQSWNRFHNVLIQLGLIDKSELLKITKKWVKVELSILGG